MWRSQHGDALVTFTVNGKVRLGSDTTAHIRTGTLLGQRVLTLNSAGRARLRSSDVIPVTRTQSPYSLTDAVSDLATNVAATDTATLNQSLDSLSATIDAVSPQLGTDVRRADPPVAGDQQPRPHAGCTAAQRAATSPGSCRIAASR